MKNNNYDERQKIDRLKAYRLGYWVLFCYLAINSIMFNHNVKWADVPTMCMTGIMISFVISISYMIFKGSYITRTESVKVLIIIMIITDMILIFYVVDTFINGKIIQNGKLTHEWYTIILGSSNIIITICFIIKELLNRKKAKTSEEE